MIVKRKKAQGTKKCVMKRILKFNDYKDCLLNNEIISKSHKGFKSEKYIVYTKKINKIALSSNDNKRLQNFNKITIYSYRTNASKVCQSDMLSKYKKLILMN